MMLPPIAWRQGEGYIHPEEAPPPPPFTAAPVFVSPFLPLHGGFWGPPPPFGSSGFAAPPFMFPFQQPGYWAPPPAAPPTPSKPDKKEDTPDKKEDTPDKKQDTPDKKQDTPNKKQDTPDEFKLPGGHLPGSVFHYQEGKYVRFHVIYTSSTDLDTVLTGTHDGYISTEIHEFNENVSIETLMQKLKAGEGGKMTQVFERGKAEFTRGTTWEVGGGMAKKTLKEYGWGGAGVDGDVESIWVVVQKKEEKK
ncbi:hypothetical protein E2P81_ATG11325 [Venturia nashicola]|nr:hypothetical protein E2P81_ATG11325 [Venturia nashicola]